MALNVRFPYTSHSNVVAPGCQTLNPKPTAKAAPSLDPRHTTPGGQQCCLRKIAQDTAAAGKHKEIAEGRPRLRRLGFLSTWHLGPLLRVNPYRYL